MATYYVATNGNDGNPGTIGSPKLTIAAGMGLLHAGDTLYIRNGTYTAFVFNNGNNIFPDGSSGNLITIASYPGETCTWRSTNENCMLFKNCGSYVKFDGIIFDGTSLNGSGGASGNSAAFFHFRQDAGTTTGLQFVNCTIHDTPFKGMFIGPSTSGWTVQGNLAYQWGRGSDGTNRGGNAFYLEGNNHLVKGNTCYITSLVAANQEYSGIRVANNSGDGTGANNNIIDGNVIYFADSLNFTPTATNQGIIFGTGDGNIVRNNIVYNFRGASDATACLLWQQGAWSQINNKIYNNTFHNCTNGITTLISGAPIIAAAAKNNIFYQSGTDISDPNGVITTATNLAHATNPGVVSSSTHDYHLTSSSVCRDTGTSTSPDVTLDFDGTSRPQNTIYDIGAYEYIVTTPPTVVPCFEPFTGTGALSADWTAMLRSPGATLSRSSNQCKGDLATTNDCMAFWASSSFNAAQYSQINIVTGLATGTHYAELLVRASGSASTAQCYGIVTDGAGGNPDSFFFKMIGNNVTVLTGISTPAANGNSIRLTISTDHVLKFWIDSGTGWREIASYSLGANPEIVSGAPGIGTYDDTTLTMRLDNWEGGNYSPGSGLLLLGMGS